MTIGPWLASSTFENRHFKHETLAILRSNAAQADKSKLLKAVLHFASLAIWSGVQAPGMNARGGAQFVCHSSTIAGGQERASSPASVAGPLPTADPVSSPQEAVVTKRHATRLAQPARAKLERRIRIALGRSRRSSRIRRSVRLVIVGSHRIGHGAAVRPGIGRDAESGGTEQLTQPVEVFAEAHGVRAGTVLRRGVANRVVIVRFADRAARLTPTSIERRIRRTVRTCCVAR